MGTISKNLSNAPGYSQYNNRYAIALDYSEILPDNYIETNKTNVYLRGRVYSNYSGYKYYGYNNNGTLKIDDSEVKIDSNTLTVDSSGEPGNEGVTVVEGTFPVTHNPDGTKSITISFTFSTSYPKIAGNTISTTIVLTTIPRASSVSVSANPILDAAAVTITCNRASNSFKHTINIKDGSTIIESFTNVAETKSWAPTLESYAALITNSSSKEFTIECITYNGNTNVGTKTIPVIVNVPNNSDTKPSISSITLSEGRAASQEGHDGVPSSWGCYVQNQSKLNIVINGTTKYGAVLSSVSTTVDGTTITTDQTNILQNSGSNLDLKSVVTDSRGFSSDEFTKKYDVVEYAPPKITKFTAERCDSDGNASDDGTYLLYTFVGSISPVNNKNSKLFRIGYKEKDSSLDYTYVNVVNNAYTVNKSTPEILPGVTLDPTKSYDIIFEAQDYFYYNEPVSKPAVITIGSDLLNFASNGKSVAIGQLSTATGDEKKLEIGMDTYITGALYIDGIKMIWFEDDGE